MNARSDLARRMLTEAEQRIDEFGIILAVNSSNRTTQLRRPLSLLQTSFRNMDWIIDAPHFFELPHQCFDQAVRLKPEIKSLINRINLQIAENQYLRSGGKRNADNSQDLTISLGGNGNLTPAEIERIDSFITVLEEAPSVDSMAVRESTTEQRLLELDKMFTDGLSFGEATNAPPILNQPEREFRAALRAIDNDIVEQIKIIEHCLPRWFSMGECPPPYYAWRIAVILRKAKERGRERKFLRAYLINFRSRVVGSMTDQLVERAEKMGIELPSIR